MAHASDRATARGRLATLLVFVLPGFLLAGMALHLVVAVVIAWVSPPASRFSTHVEAWSDGDHTLTRFRVTHSQFGQRWSWEALASHSFGVASGANSEGIDILRPWSDGGNAPRTVRLPRRDAPDENEREVISAGRAPGLYARWPIEHTAGWPTPALRCWTPGVFWVWGATAWSGPTTVDGGIELAKPARGGGPFVPHTLPIMPAWPGLLIGGAFWGAVLFVLVHGLRGMRRARRRRRGACAACGYTLDGLAICPECGLAARAAQ